MDIKMPHQLFINNQFVDSISGKYFQTVNPTDESVCYDDGRFSFFLYSLIIKLYIVTDTNVGRLSGNL